MKFQSLSPTLIQAFTAITLGAIPWQNPAQAVVELNLNEGKSNLSRPQLLVQDSQQMAILTEGTDDNLSTENIADDYSFARSQKLNTLVDLNQKSPPIIISNEHTIPTLPIVADISDSSRQNIPSSPESIYIPVQSSPYNSNSINSAVNRQEKNASSEILTTSTANKTSYGNLVESSPLNVTPINTGENDFDSDKPVLISPPNLTNTIQSDQVMSINDNNLVTETNIDLSSKIELIDSQTTEKNKDNNGSQLMGSVPIEVNYYNPAVTPSVGSMVSPELPYLYPADEYLPDGQKPRVSDGYIWPAKGVLTSGYGWRWGRMHKGIDIAAPVGTPILAVADGKVLTAGWHSGGYGNLVKLKHDDGSVTLYAHNSKIFVRRGQEIRQGQHIANMGSTGFSTGPHLHFEIHARGQGAINPIALLPRK